MTTKQFFKSKGRYLLVSMLPILLITVAACSSSPGSGAVPQLPQNHTSSEAVVEVEKVVVVDREAEISAPAPQAEEAPAADVDADTPAGNLAPVSNQPDVYSRLIIKNAEVELQVEDTDAAINRSLGIVSEFRGYVVSNRTWFSDDDHKYASLTIGVPAQNFEEMLRRLKDLAVIVTNESVSGQDVTDEFVDLESRLRNLDATADRIRDFLAQAKNIEESLEVNVQLSQIEVEIEQVKGRIAYLRDRSSFSTITLQFSPYIVLPTPTPTFTPTPTSTPTPTATPVIWSAARTFDDASTVTRKTATGLFQFTVDLIIWAAIVFLPFILPFIVLGWVVYRVVRRIDTLNPPSAS